MRVAALVLLAGCGSPLPEATPRDLAQPAQVGLLDHHPVLASGALRDGTRVLERAGPRWRPLAPETLPPTLQVHHGSRLRLDDGALWMALAWADADGALRLRWVAPAHDLAELVRRRRTLDEEAARLPAASAARVQPVLPLLAAVSAVEGDFGGAATHAGDPMASLGILQWGAPRKSTLAADSSLGRFFTRLQRRAASGDDPVAAAAHKQLRQVRFAIERGHFTLAGRRATAGEIERTLSSEMGRGALRTYQLIAAADFWESSGGAQLRDAASRAVLLSLAVNRPSWVDHALKPHVPADAISLAERAISLYPPQERERRARRYATSLLVAD